MRPGLDFSVKEIARTQSTATISVPKELVITGGVKLNSNKLVLSVRVEHRSIKCVNRGIYALITTTHPLNAALYDILQGIQS